MKKLDLVRTFKWRVKRNNIHWCLIALGADFKDVFSTPYKYGVKGQHKKIGGSIYKRYGTEHLRVWVKELYRERAREFHPDITGDDKDMKIINDAYSTAMRLINSNGREE